MANAIRIVFAHELRSSLRSLLYWLVPTSLLVAMTSALQPALARGALAAKIEAMPLALRKAFGVEIVDFHRPAAFLATNFTSVTLTSALFAASLGAAMIAKEETLRTAELLYTQPTSRAQILLGKVAALVVHVVAFPAMLAVVALGVLGSVAERPLEPAAILRLFAGATSVALCFAGLGMLIAALVRDKRSAVAAAVGAVIGTFFIGALSALHVAVQPLRWLSPHKLADPILILMQGLDAGRTLLLLVVGATAGAIAIVRYRTQDIHA